MKGLINQTEKCLYSSNGNKGLMSYKDMPEEFKNNNNALK